LQRDYFLGKIVLQAVIERGRNAWLKTEVEMCRETDVGQGLM
jgi:hypothetical protein